MKNILKKAAALLAVAMVLASLTTVDAFALSDNVHDILFDYEWYYAANPDVAKAFGKNPTALRRHYEQHGKAEGRAPSALFDPKVYLGLYPDLRAAFGSNYVAAYNHFVSCGINESRQGSAHFSVAVYKSNYADLRQAFGSNNLKYLKHYREYGKRENRNAITPISPAPTPAPVSSLRSPVPSGARFNTRSKDFDGKTWYHDINVGITLGTPVYAITDGTVSYRQAYTTVNGTRYLTSYGNHIVFTSADGTYTAKYCHLNSFEGVSLQIPSSRSLQRSGSSGRADLATRPVKAGDVLGYIGRTGNASGVHLHFELYRSGTRIDPTSVIPGLIR